MTYTGSKSVTELQEGILESIQHIIPVVSSLEGLTYIQDYIPFEHGVLVGLTGDYKGKLLYKAEEEFFSKMAEKMYGMELTGDMLTSFIGEFGNMLSGRFCTFVSTNGGNIDITAPTVVTGNCKISGFKEGCELEISLEKVGQLRVYILLDI
ncbi:chemotaxis protein CheX [Bacillus sp. AK128]